MDEIKASLLSPAWWMSAFFFALFVNLLSAYAKTPVDRVFSLFSTMWRTRTVRAAQAFSDDCNRLLLSPNALAHAFESEVRARTRVGTMLGFAIFFMLMMIAVQISGSNAPRFVPKLLQAAGLVTMLFATMYHREAIRLSAAVSVARKARIAADLDQLVRPDAAAAPPEA